MKMRKAASLLESNGFRFERDATHGEMWGDEHGGRILLSRHLDKSDHRAIKNFVSEMERAIKRRPVVPTLPSLQEGLRRISAQPQTIKKEEVVVNALKIAQTEEKRGWPATLPKEKKDALWARIRFHLEAGLTQQATADAVNKEGFRSALNEPIQTAYVASVVYYTKKRAKTARAKAPPKISKPLRQPPEPTKKTSGLPDTVIAILTDPDLTDRQKVRMIAAYAE